MKKEKLRKDTITSKEWYNHQIPLSNQPWFNSKVEHLLSPSHGLLIFSKCVNVTKSSHQLCDKGALAFDVKIVFYTNCLGHKEKILCFHRVGKHGKVFLTVPSLSSTAEEKFIKKGAGDDSLLDLNPEDTVFYVGGVPSNFRVSPSAIFDLFLISLIFFKINLYNLSWSLEELSSVSIILNQTV